MTKKELKAKIEELEQRIAVLAPRLRPCTVELCFDAEAYLDAVGKIPLEPFITVDGQPYADLFKDGQC